MQYYKTKITQLAENDLMDIGNHITYELKNPIAALNIIKGISKEIKSLEKFPKRNRLEENIMFENLNVRKVNHKEYKIYYLVDDESLIVYVVRIVHRLANNRIWIYHTYDFKEKK